MAQVNLSSLKILSPQFLVTFEINNLAKRLWVQGWVKVATGMAELRQDVNLVR